jgi:hypothetical protein
MSNAVKEITCSSAEAFLHELDRGNSFWEGKMHFWAFRGHSNDEEYELVPSALREKVKLGYTFAPMMGIQTTNRQQIDAELKIIHEFFWLIDSQGLSIPGDSNLLRTPSGWREIEEEIRKKGWPIDGILPLLAIAQHYGVPTRLLDWTDKPLAAAFFAAKEAATRVAKKKTVPSAVKYLSVWALNLDWIIHDAFPGEKRKLSVYVVTAPRATNPNLHAQGGVFTTEHKVKSEFKKRLLVRTVNELVKEKWKLLRAVAPVMMRLRLPVEEAGKLLRLLNQEQINSATLFPGYKGAAEALKERSLWDNAERPSYWLEKKGTEIIGE